MREPLPVIAKRCRGTSRLSSVTNSVVSFFETSGSSVGDELVADAMPERPPSPRMTAYCVTRP